MITSASAYGVTPSPYPQPPPVQEAVSQFLQSTKQEPDIGEASRSQSVRARVLEESIALQSKITTLNDFILTNPDYKTLQFESRDLLTRQLKVMREYADILIQRLQYLPA